MTRTIGITELQPFGVEIDLDLSTELEPEVAAELRRLYEAHDLVVARGQRLTMDDQIRLMGHLGPVLLTVDSVGEISRESPIGLGGAALCFHSDYAYSPEPLLGLSLHALDVVDGETSTLFAAGRTAYDALPADERERFDGLDALQVFGANLDRRNRHEEVATLPSTPHPVVQDHPGSGGRFVFAPEMTTDSIVGVAADESERLVQRLFSVLYAPENVYEHRWRTGDVVIWNNVTVVHARGDYSSVDRRVLQRVAIGTKGYYELYPEMAEEMVEHGWSDDASNPVS